MQVRIAWYRPLSNQEGLCYTMGQRLRLDRPSYRTMGSHLYESNWIPGEEQVTGVECSVCFILGHTLIVVFSF